MAELSLKIATGNYGHTLPLYDGTVASERVDFEAVDVPVIINAFRRMIRDLEFDVSEMALSTYLCAKAHGKPITALPIFLVRAFHHGSISYSVNSGIKTPADLQGRRVGVRAYTVSTGVWIRGILASQYGVDLNKVTWVINSDEHVAEYQAPANVETVSFDKSLADYLADGEIDAAIGVGAAPDKGIELLIPDADAAAAASYESTHILPINHTLVVRDEHLAAHPWLAVELFSLFRSAKQDFLPKLPTAEGLKTYDAVHQQMQRTIGGDPLPFGIEANRDTLEAFVQYNVDQHVIPKKVALEDVFEPSTLELVD